MTVSISIQMNGARTHELGEVVGLALASALEKHTGINELHLGCCSFTNQTGLAIASAIAKNPSVKKFSKYNCKNIDDQTLALMVAALEKNVGLEELSLSEMLLGDEAGIAISNMLSRNQTLLNMTITQGDNKWASSPPPTMTDQTGLAIASALQKNTSLQALFMICCMGFTDKTGNALLETLERNKTLKEINLNGSSIDSNLCQKITETMKHA